MAPTPAAPGCGEGGDVAPEGRPAAVRPRSWARVARAQGASHQPPPLKSAAPPPPPPAPMPPPRPPPPRPPPPKRPADLEVRLAAPPLPEVLATGNATRS